MPLLLPDQLGAARCLTPDARRADCRPWLRTEHTQGSRPRVDEIGHGLLHFNKLRRLPERLESRAYAPLRPSKGQCRKVACSAPSQLAPTLNRSFSTKWPP